MSEETYAQKTTEGDYAKCVYCGCKVDRRDIKKHELANHPNEVKKATRKNLELARIQAMVNR